MSYNVASLMSVRMIRQNFTEIGYSLFTNIAIYVYNYIYCIGLHTKHACVFKNVTKLLFINICSGVNIFNVLYPVIGVCKLLR